MLQPRACRVARSCVLPLLRVRGRVLQLLRARSSVLLPMACCVVCSCRRCTRRRCGRRRHRRRRHRRRRHRHHSVYTSVYHRRCRSDCRCRRHRRHSLVRRRHRRRRRSRRRRRRRRHVARCLCPCISWMSRSCLTPRRSWVTLSHVAFGTALVTRTVWAARTAHRGAHALRLWFWAHVRVRLTPSFWHAHSQRLTWRQ